MAEYKHGRVGTHMFVRTHVEESVRQWPTSQTLLPSSDCDFQREKKKKTRPHTRMRVATVCVAIAALVVAATVGGAAAKVPF